MNHETPSLSQFVSLKVDSFVIIFGFFLSVHVHTRPLPFFPHCCPIVVG